MINPNNVNRAELCIFCPERGTFCSDLRPGSQKLEFHGEGYYVVDNEGGKTLIQSIGIKVLALVGNRRKTLERELGDAIARRAKHCAINVHNNTQTDPETANYCATLDERVLEPFAKSVLLRPVPLDDSIPATHRVDDFITDVLKDTDIVEPPESPSEDPEDPSL